jgi:hypothetical protein
MKDVGSKEAGKEAGKDAAETQALLAIEAEVHLNKAALDNEHHDWADGCGWYSSAYRCCAIGIGDEQGIVIVRGIVAFEPNIGHRLDR